MAKRPSRKNYKKSNGNKRSNYKPKMSKEVDNDMPEEVGHKYNDVSWYSKNETMLRDSASFSYNSPLGNPIPWANVFAANQGTTTYYQPQTIPGLISLRYVPTIGVSNSSSSPANLAAQNIYTYVRYMNSGAKNYDQADLMLYLLAMDNIYMMWNWAKRIYGYLRVYSQKNKYMPRVYASADNIDFQGFIDNLADYRYNLNALAARISSFCVPAVMPLFIRHSWMASNIYMDSNNAKAQQYMYVPDVYYQYDETSSEYGGKLVAKYLLFNPTSVLSYMDVINTIATMLDQVAYSEDIGVMSGDILKAYGQDRLFKLSPVEADYTVLPVYNEEVLNQIHNSNSVMTTGNIDVTQDPNSGFIVWDPQFTSNEILLQKAAMINMPWDDVTPANTMVATRLTTLVGDGTTAGTKRFMSLGSEFIRRRFIFLLNADGTFKWLIIPNAFTINDNLDDDHQNAVVMTGVTNFDWHPLMPIFVKTGDNDSLNYEFISVMGDVTNYTIIEQYNLTQMHTAALLSEFNVPQIGSF